MERVPTEQFRLNQYRVAFGRLYGNQFLRNEFTLPSLAIPEQNGIRFVSNDYKRYQLFNY